MSATTPRLRKKIRRPLANGLKRTEWRVQKTDSQWTIFSKAQKCGLKLMYDCLKKNPHGWHDFYNSKKGKAGAHATLEGYAFLKRRNKTISKQSIDDYIFAKHLCRLFNPKCDPAWDRAEQQTEALCTTIKVARFIQCAVKFRPEEAADYQPLIHELVKKLWDCRLKDDEGPMWGHFLDSANLFGSKKDNTPSWFASAIALEALHPLIGQQDVSSDLLEEFSARFMKDWNDNTSQSKGLNAHWMRSALPVIRVFSQFEPSQKLPAAISLEKMLGTYLTEQTFYLGDTTVETYRYLIASQHQKKGVKKKVDQRTDYVSYEDTLVLLSAVANAVRNKRVHSSYITYCQNWLCYHRTHKDSMAQPSQLAGYAIDLLKLCGTYSGNKNDIPQGKRRFSYIISILDCLATILESPPAHEKIPMFIRPKIFKEHPYVLDPYKAFVAMPFSAPASEAVWLVISSICRDFGIKAIRTDRASTGENRVIMHDIWEMINESQFVIAVCTGANPNVYYEIGMADTLGKTVFLCGEISDDFLFDLKGNQRTIYDPTDTTSLQEKLKRFLAALGYKALADTTAAPSGPTAANLPNVATVRKRK